MILRLRWHGVCRAAAVSCAAKKHAAVLARPSQQCDPVAQIRAGVGFVRQHALSRRSLWRSSLFDCTAPHCTAPQVAARHCTAQRRTALHRTARNRTAPHRTARHRTALHCTARHGTARHRSPRLAAVLFCRGRTFSSLLPKALAARGKKRQARVCRQKRSRKFTSPSENVYFVSRARVAVTIAVTPVEIDSFASG